MPTKEKKLSSALIHWYNKSARDLPWRRTIDPYLIWISEIILQQTTVDQGLPYYTRFIDRFPDIQALAQAKPDTVMKLWEGLGYYSRARNLHYTAKYVYSELGGLFPDSYDGLLTLRGIGPYTAAAIASFCYNLPHAVVDGNVLRVITRLYGLQLSIDEKEGKNEVQKRAARLLSFQQPAVFNQAIMELGALVCSYKNPDCSNCPWKKDCKAYGKDEISRLPIRTKKIKKRTRYFHFYIIEYKGQFLVEKRLAKDIWRDLHQFPLLEMAKETFSNEKRPLEWILPKEAIFLSATQGKQTLTHQKIEAKFFHYRVPKKRSQERMFWVQYKSLLGHSWPKLIRNFIEESLLIG